MAGFQCRAAGWHSDEDNDVLVSHQITEQTCSEQSGSGQPPPPPPPLRPSPHRRLHPLEHRLSERSWSFSVPIPNPLAQRREDRTGWTRISKRSGGTDGARRRGERLLQLGGAADACPSVSVCHFTSFKVTSESRTLVFTGRHAGCPHGSYSREQKSCQHGWSLPRNTHQ